MAMKANSKWPYHSFWKAGQEEFPACITSFVFSFSAVKPLSPSRAFVFYSGGPQSAVEWRRQPHGAQLHQPGAVQARRQGNVSKSASIHRAHPGHYLLVRPLCDWLQLRHLGERKIHFDLRDANNEMATRIAFDAACTLDDDI
eukprot:scaffold226887_cov31-Prasinocladus_malaysianus.AAC.2